MLIVKFTDDISMLINFIHIIISDTRAQQLPPRRMHLSGAASQYIESFFKILWCIKKITVANRCTHPLEHSLGDGFQHTVASFQPPAYAFTTWKKKTKSIKPKL